MSCRSDLRVRGTATDDELAALLSALVTRASPAGAEPSRYEHWRRGRLTALQTCDRR